MSFEVFTPIAAAVVTSLAGILATLLSSWKRRADEVQQKALGQISTALLNEESVRKAAAIERTAERLPVGLTPDQFTVRFAQIANLVPSGTVSSTTAAVESLIGNYHEQALGQAKAQFWFSVAAASIGFAWILWAGTKIDPDKALTIAKTLPGIVMDAVAFLFFRQASETRQRATDLYDRLRRDKQLTESATLVESIEDTRLRSAVKAQLALHMSGLQPAAIDLSTFLSGAIAARSIKKAKRPAAQSPEHAGAGAQKPGNGQPTEPISPAPSFGVDES